MGLGVVGLEEDEEVSWELQVELLLGVYYDALLVQPLDDQD
jgi:hypothetical protein